MPTQIFDLEELDEIVEALSNSDVTMRVHASACHWQVRVFEDGRLQRNAIETFETINPI